MAVIDRLEAFERAETWMDAERELDAVAAERPPAEVGLGDRYDELVEEAVEADEDFEAAARLHDLEEPDAYCGVIELALRRASPPGSPTALAAPLRVDELEEFAAERKLDADSSRARSGLAAELARTGQALLWPPSRNDPCWCGSGRRYKRCCGGL